MTEHSFSVAEAQTLCFGNRIPFYTYRLPGADEVVFGAQLSAEPDVFRGLEHCRAEKGFIITPFDPSSRSLPYFIKADVSFTDRLTDADMISALQRTAFDTPFRETETNDLTRQEYLDAVRRLIDTLRREALRKVVFARSFAVPLASYAVSPALFERMKKYRHAFLFMVSIPGKSAWLGVSPELFLSRNRDGFRTMALAATQPVTGCARPVEWTAKEREEQQIVADYVAEVFASVFARPPQREEAVTVQAGNVYHLCSRFHSSEQLSAGETDRLIARMHPTPAVCGLPKNRAMQLIAETERHDRGYYAGLLGPVRRDGTFDLFINIRSMELFAGTCRLYAGGGVTHRSDPESEWTETCRKADILLNLIPSPRHECIVFRP
ncbi:MAG: chorismate-binding protein [Bacteroidales bacterium]|jgi:isochorismate synthase|nr:chorismate-binding protein [Bacteroidales bacterium]